MSSIDVLINQLATLELKYYPLREIDKIFKNWGKVVTLTSILDPGTSIIRVRPNETFLEVFNTRASLSYKPEKYNTTYQRASTPNNTMFYGSIVPTKLSATDFRQNRLTSSLEGIKTFRENIQVNHEKVTYSRWEVVEPIRLATICHYKDFLSDGSMLSELNKEYTEFMNQIDPKLAQNSVTVNDFISEQFAKNPINYDYEYMISAYYAELAVIMFGLDGVVYPSVKAEGRGLNVALSKESADNKIKLIAAGECRIMRNGFNPEIITESTIEIVDDTKPFIFTKLKTEKELEEMWKLCLQNPQLD